MMGILRHSTFIKYLDDIVGLGLLPGPRAYPESVMRNWDKDYVSFEKDPPTDWLKDNLAMLKGKSNCETIALEFYESRIRKSYKCLDKPNMAANDLCLEPNPFIPKEELNDKVGMYVLAYLGPTDIISLEYLTDECKEMLENMGYSLDLW